MTCRKCEWNDDSQHRYVRHPQNQKEEHDEHCRLHCHQEHFPQQHLQTSRSSTICTDWGIARRSSCRDHRKRERQGQTQNPWHFFLECVWMSFFLEVNLKKNRIIQWSLDTRNSILMIAHFIGSAAERHFASFGRSRTRRDERLTNDDELENYFTKWKLQLWDFCFTVMSIQRREVQYSWNVQIIFELMIVDTTPKKTVSHNVGHNSTHAHHFVS